MTFDPSELRADFRDEQFWTSQTPRFLSFARALIVRRRWRGSYADAPAGGEEAQDYVMRAAALIFEGQRRCPSDVDSVRFVLGVIRIRRQAALHDSLNFDGGMNPIRRLTGPAKIDTEVDVEFLLLLRRTNLGSELVRTLQPG